MALFYRILQFREGLTYRANMRSALADNELLDLGAADRTRLALATINSKMILKIAAAIDPVYAGAVAADAFLQYLSD